MTTSFPNGVCPHGEDAAPGAGCIKPAGHDGAHCVVPGDPDDGYCPAEYPDPGGLGFAGHLCDRFAGHLDEHKIVARIGGQRTVLTWPKTDAVEEPRP